MLLLAVLLVVVAPTPGSSHGRLIEPPSRASAWRFGFATPHNYNDHELYCGGFSRQWNKNSGKCGVCGDAWDQKTPRPHEYGGRFGQGVIVRKYNTDATIEIKVELTANHFGYFEFRVCPDFESTTQECLDKHVLERENQPSTKFFPTDGNRIYAMNYKLPKGFTCEHCLIQWRYIAGNNWGKCSNGSEAVGCGNQEEFRACADIAIGVDYNATRTRPPYVLPTRRTTTESTSTETSDVVRQDTLWTGVFISLATLLVVLMAVVLLYLYYYRGRKIKALLTKKKPLPPPQPPVRPPRLKKQDKPDVPEFKTDIDNNIEPGFETIRLNK